MFKTMSLTIFLFLDNPIAVNVPKIVDTTVAIIAIDNETHTAAIIS